MPIDHYYGNVCGENLNSRQKESTNLKDNAEQKEEVSSLLFPFKKIT